MRSGLFSFAVAASGKEFNRMQLPVKNMAGQQVGAIELSDAVFAAPVNSSLMHQALVRIRPKSVVRSKAVVRSLGAKKVLVVPVRVRHVRQTLSVVVPFLDHGRESIPRHCQRKCSVLHCAVR